MIKPGTFHMEVLDKTLKLAELAVQCRTETLEESVSMVIRYIWNPPIIIEPQNLENV